MRKSTAWGPTASELQGHPEESLSPMGRTVSTTPTRPVSRKAQALAPRREPLVAAGSLAPGGVSPHRNKVRPRLKVIFPNLQYGTMEPRGPRTRPPGSPLPGCAAGRPCRLIRENKRVLWVKSEKCPPGTILRSGMQTHCRRHSEPFPQNLSQFPEPRVFRTWASQLTAMTEIASALAKASGWGGPGKASGAAECGLLHGPQSCRSAAGPPPPGPACLTGKRAHCSYSCARKLPI